MSLGDDAIIPCFTLLTDMPMNEIETMKDKMKAGDNPMVWKKRLAFELTRAFNSEANAEKAQVAFESIHQKGNAATADDAQQVSVDPIASLNIIDVLVSSGTVSSKSEVKRLLDQKAIEIDNEEATASSVVIDGSMVRIGKKKFVSIKLQ